MVDRLWSYAAVAFAVAVVAKDYVWAGSWLGFW